MSAEVNDLIKADTQSSQPRNRNRSLLHLGTIKQAKIHASAQRPLKIIGRITKDIVVCNCCSLPIATKNVIVPFNFTDANIAFSSTGIGTYLYFHFFQYIMFLMLIVLCMAAIPTVIISFFNIREIINLCKVFKAEDIESHFDFKICFLLADKATYSFNDWENWLLYFNSELFSHYRTFYNMENQRQRIDPALVDYNLVNFLTLIVLMVINIMVLVLIKNQAWIADILNYSPSDYSLLIDNIQHTVDAFREVKDQLPYLKEKTLNEIEAFKLYLLNDVIQYENQANIKCLNLCFKLKELVNLEMEKAKDENMLMEALYSPNQLELNKKDENSRENHSYYKGFCCCKTVIPITQIRKTIREKQEEITKLIHLCTNDSLKSFAGCCFITFNHIKQQEEYYSYFPKSFVKTIAFYFIHVQNYLCCCFVHSEKRRKFFKKQKLRVHSAPEPEDVIWENMQLSQINRFLRLILVFFISIILIVVSGCIVVGLNYSQYQADQNLDNNRFEVKYGVSFTISIAITIVNAIFQIVLEQLTHLERQRTKTEFYLSFSLKLAIFTFINSTVIPYVSNVIHDNEKDIMHNTLINNLLFIFLSNSFLTPALWLFNIKFIMNRLLIWWYTRKDQKILKSQKELNALYEFPNMDISFKYSFIAKTIAMTLFYLPIFPLGVVISFVGLIFAFCIERFMFTRLYKRPEMLNEKMCLFYVDYFIVILFAYGVGNWIFLAELSSSKVFAYINIIFFGVMILFPFSILFKWNLLGFSEAEVNQETYDDMYFNFSNDYERINPMTRIQGMKEYLRRLKENNMLSEKVYEMAVRNMSKVNLLELYYQSTLNQSNYQAGQQLMKMDTKVNNETQLNKAASKVFSGYGMKQRKMENQVEEFPLDMQIKANFIDGMPMDNNDPLGEQYIGGNGIEGNELENIQASGSGWYNPYMSNVFYSQPFWGHSNTIINEQPQLQAQAQGQCQVPYHNTSMPLYGNTANTNANANPNADVGYSNQDMQYHPQHSLPQPYIQSPINPASNSNRPITSMENQGYQSHNYNPASLAPIPEDNRLNAEDISITIPKP